MIHEVASTAVCASVWIGTAPPPPPGPTMVAEHQSLPPGETLSAAFFRTFEPVAEVMIASDADLTAAVIAKSDLSSFAAGQTVPLIAAASGRLGRSEPATLPTGELALVCRNSTGSPVRVAIAIVAPRSFAEKALRRSLTMSPGENLHLPVHLGLDRPSLFLLTSGVKLTLTSPSDAERSALGAPLLPLMLGGFTPQQAAFMTSGERYADGLGNGPATVVLTNTRDVLSTVHFASDTFDEPIVVQNEVLPPIQALTPVFSAGQIGSFAEGVLRTREQPSSRRFPGLLCDGVEAGDKVTVFFGGATSTSTTARSVRPILRFASGRFNQEGLYAIRAGSERIVDGQTRYSSTRRYLFVQYDTTAPLAASTPDLAAESDAGSSDTDNITGLQTVELHGTGEPFSRAALLENGRLARAPSTVVSPTGEWTLAYTPARAGTVRLAARLIDEAGNASPNSPSLQVRFEAPPPAPSGLDVDPSDRLSTQSGVVTTNPFPTITGRAKAGAPVRVLVNGAPVGVTTTDSSGRWKFKLESELPPFLISQITAAQQSASGFDSEPSQPLRVRTVTIQ